MTKYAIALFTTILSLQLIQSAVALEETQPSSESFRRAEKLLTGKKLDTNVKWLSLLHYKSSIWGGYKSQADSPNFFLSPDGKTNPKTELLENIKQFLSTEIQAVPEQKEVSHVQCRFPARFRWVKKELQELNLPFPKIICTEYEKYLNRIAAKSISVVFSSYHVHSAASTFGHTFLRMNKAKNRKGSLSKRFELLDSGINYGAEATTSNMALYALMGIVGGFNGHYTSIPYYYTVRMYNDFESRDLWSYELDLTDDQLAWAMAHIWELGSNYYDYFFFTENCSYHILSALEAANPELDLTSELPYWVIPADTIKVIARKKIGGKSLVSQVDYRPAIWTQLQTRYSNLNEKEKNSFDELRDTNNFDGLIQSSLFSDASKAKILDTYLDYLDYSSPADTSTPQEKNPEAMGSANSGETINDEIVDSELEKTQKLRLEILGLRASLRVVSPELVVSLPQDKIPHAGHDSARATIGYGHETAEGGYVSIQQRFALHDLLDPGIGYPEDAQIEFLNLGARVYHDAFRIEPDRVSIATVYTLVPISNFSKKASWKVNIGGERVRDKSCDRCFAQSLNVGYGVTFNTIKKTKLSLMVEIDEYFSPVFMFSSVTLGLGPTLMIRSELSDDLKFLFEANARRRFFSDITSFGSLSLQLRYGLSTQSAVSAKVELFPGAKFDSSIGVNFYY